MRLQLLAQEMQSGEFGLEMHAEVVSVIHVCPNVNQEFRDRTTSPGLKSMFPNQKPLEIWQSLAPKDRFMSIGVEELSDSIAASGSADSGWTDYLTTRYGWPRGV